MKYNVIISRRARCDYDALDRRWQATIWKAFNEFLTHEPTKLGKSRIKRLHDLMHPQYRLRVGEMRVFYDVEGTQVEVLAICSKEDSAQYLLEEGIHDEDNATD